MEAPLKIVSLASVALLLATSAAYAQQPPEPPKHPPHEQDAGKPRPPKDGPPGPGMGPEGRRMPPPPPSKAAHYRVEIGDTKIDIKCADDEPSKACTDLFLQVIDKVSPKP